MDMKNLIQIKSKYLILVSKLFLFLFVLLSCNNNRTNHRLGENIVSNRPEFNKNEIITAANQTTAYLPLLKNKRVAIVTNHTSVVFKNDNSFTHLVDTLISLQVNITKVFAPEHGFRGKADAGEHVADNIDKKTNLPIVSLYGKNRKPKLEILDNIDVVLFDIQDVGVRF